MLFSLLNRKFCVGLRGNNKNEDEGERLKTTN